MNCNKGTVLMRGVDTEGGHVFMETRDTVCGKSQHLLLNFSVNLKLLLKKKKACFRNILNNMLAKAPFNSKKSKDGKNHLQIENVHNC